MIAIGIPRAIGLAPRASAGTSGVIGKRHFKVFLGMDHLVQALFNLPKAAAQVR
jgi:hypothetical protein